MVSIIIIVKDDRGIDNTLRKLFKIPKTEEFEVIVIDASEGKIDDIKEKHPSVRWIYFHSKTEKKITIPEQRNLGLAKSKGDLIVFIDANCIPTDNWLVELVRSIREDCEDMVVGLVKPISGKSIHDIFWEDWENKKYLNECPTINLALKKSVFDDVGVFDERFEAGEDVDFSWRAIDRGYKFRYNKNAVIYHDWGNLNDETKRAFAYGKGRIRLYKKYPNKWKNLLGYDMVSFIYPVYILLLPVTIFWIYYPLLLLIPIIKNIKRNPLKVVFINLIHGFGALYELFSI